MTSTTESEFVTHEEVNDVIESIYLGYEKRKDRKAITDVTKIVLINKGLYMAKISTQKTVRYQVANIMKDRCLGILC